MKRNLLFLVLILCGTPLLCTEAGTAPTEKKDQTTTTSPIQIGTTVDLSRGASNVGKAIQKCNELLFARENTVREKTHKPPLQYTVYDDQYEPTKARENIEKFISQNTHIILEPVGSALLDTYKDLIEQKKIVVLFPLAVTPILSHCISLRASYSDEVRALMHHILESNPPKKMALIYQDDAFGKLCLSVAQESLKKNPAIQVKEIPCARNDIQFAAVYEELKKDSYDCIGIFAASISARAFFSQIDSTLLSNKIFFGISDLVAENVQKVINERSISLITSNVVPDCTDTSIPVVKEFQETIKDTGVPSDALSLEIYIATAFFIDMVNHLPDTLTMEQCIDYLEKLNNYSFKGLTFTFNKADRSILNKVWIRGTNGTYTEYLASEDEVRKASDIKDVKIETKIPEQKTAETKTEPTKTSTPSEPKAAAAPIRVGSTLDLSRGAQNFGKAVEKCIELLFAQENTRREESKKPLLQSIIYDDQYEPTKARENIEKFITDKIELILEPVGTAPLEACKNLIEQKKILALFPILGIPPILPNCISMRASYTNEIRALVPYIIEKHTPKKIAIIYQDDTFGKLILPVAEKIIKQHPEIQLQEIPCKRNDIQLTSVFAELKKDSYDCIGVFTASINAHAFFNQADSVILSNKIFFGPSDLVATIIQKTVHEKNIALITSSSVPDPSDATIPIVKEFQETLKESGIPLDGIALEPYIATAFFIDMVNHLPHTFSMDQCIDYLEKLTNYSFKGLPLTFNKADRTLLSRVWIRSGDGKYIAYEIKENEVSPASETKTPEKTISTAEKKEANTAQALPGAW